MPPASSAVGAGVSDISGYNPLEELITVLLDQGGGPFRVGGFGAYFEEGLFGVGADVDPLGGPEVDLEAVDRDDVIPLIALIQETHNRSFGFPRAVDAVVGHKEVGQAGDDFTDRCLTQAKVFEQAHGREQSVGNRLQIGEDEVAGPIGGEENILVRGPHQVAQIVLCRNDVTAVAVHDGLEGTRQHGGQGDRGAGIGVHGQLQQE